MNTGLILGVDWTGEDQYPYMSPGKIQVFQQVSRYHPHQRRGLTAVISTSAGAFQASMTQVPPPKPQPLTSTQGPVRSCATFPRRVQLTTSSVTQGLMSTSHVPWFAERTKQGEIVVELLLGITVPRK